MNAQRKNRNLTLIVAIAVLALIGAIGVIVLSMPQVSGSPYARYQNIPQSRTDDGAFILGDPEAPITVVEFGDFACPHCQDFHEVAVRFIDNFVATGKARFEFRMFISGADPTYGPYTAALAECAAEQRDGAFWPAHDVLFEMGRAQGRFNDRVARSLADSLELNFAELVTCANGANQVRTDMNLGQQLNVQSTPTIMIRLDNEQPQFINDGTRIYDRGGVPYELLQAVTASAQ
jgi:protein-disulfide isomerase